MLLLAGDNDKTYVHGAAIFLGIYLGHTVGITKRQPSLKGRLDSLAAERLSVIGNEAAKTKNS